MNRVRIKQWLKKHEGVRDKPYMDTEDIWTWGVGHNLESDKLSIPVLALDLLVEGDVPGAIDLTLDTDISQCLGYVINVCQTNDVDFTNLNAIKQEALVHMTFQLGVGGVNKFKNFWAAVRDDNDFLASKELLDSKWFKQTPVRSEFVAYLWRNGKYPSAE